LATFLPILVAKSLAVKSYLEFVDFHPTGKYGMQQVVVPFYPGHPVVIFLLDLKVIVIVVCIPVTHFATLCERNTVIS
jgi:hypothetical protein